MLTTISADKTEDLRRWDDFVASHPQGTPFHLTAWIAAIAGTYGLQPRLFVLRDCAGSLRAVAPFIFQGGLFGRRRLVCLPFTDSCCPLGAGESDRLEILEGVREDASAHSRHVEVRGPLPAAAGFAEVNYYKFHVISLHPDPDEVLRHVDKRTVIYNIRRAQKAGVEVVEDNTPRGCEEYYRLNILTRKKHGIPSQPKEFFRALSRDLVADGRASILLAVHESRVVAGGVLFKLGDKVYYKYSASDPGVLNKFSPNHLLAWTAIRNSCLGGFRTFNFGRTAPDNKGLMRYKKMWGGEVRDLPYSYYPRSPGASMKREHGRLMETLKGAWRLLPEPLASRIGPKIIKHFG